MRGDYVVVVAVNGNNETVNNSQTTRHTRPCDRDGDRR